MRFPPRSHHAWLWPLFRWVSFLFFAAALVVALIALARGGTVMVAVFCTSAALFGCQWRTARHAAMRFERWHRRARQ